jgi:hypothetical protein
MAECKKLRDMIGIGIIPWPRPIACTGAPPPDPVGACCLSGGGCTPNQTLAQCNAVGGTWLQNQDCTACVGGT